MKLECICNKIFVGYAKRFIKKPKNIEYNVKTVEYKNIKNFLDGDVLQCRDGLLNKTYSKKINYIKKYDIIIPLIQSLRYKLDYIFIDKDLPYDNCIVSESILVIRCINIDTSKYLNLILSTPAILSQLQKTCKLNSSIELAKIYSVTDRISKSIIASLNINMIDSVQMKSLIQEYDNANQKFQNIKHQIALTQQ